MGCDWVALTAGRCLKKNADNIAAYMSCMFALVGLFGHRCT